MTSPAKEPLVSIALCTYNGARFLREQIESLLAQTYGNLEIVAVDDDSKDDTLAVLREFESRDPRLKVFTNSSNLGHRKNFERAMSLCSGEFLAPCDQDDIWSSHKISALRSAMGDRMLAYCDSEFIDETGGSLNVAMSDRCTMVSTDDAVVFAAGNCVAGHSLMFKRALLATALPIPACFYYDWWLAVVAAAGGGVVYCPDRLVRYRLHADNVTNGLRAPAVRVRGYRWLRQYGFRARLECLAKLPSPSRSFAEQLRDLCLAHEDQWFSPALAWCVFQHAPRIFKLHKPRRARLEYALKFLSGVRLKRLGDPHGYARVTPLPEEGMEPGVTGQPN